MLDSETRSNPPALKLRASSQTEMFLMALIIFHRDKGDIGSAVLYADKLVHLTPGDPNVIALRNSLKK